MQWPFKWKLYLCDHRSTYDMCSGLGLRKLYCVLYKSIFDCWIFFNWIHNNLCLSLFQCFKIGLKLQRWSEMIDRVRGYRQLMGSGAVQSFYCSLWGSEEKCLDICESSSCDTKHDWITLLLVFSAAQLPRPGFLEYNRKLGPTISLPLIGQFILSKASDWLPAQCGDSCYGCQGSLSVILNITQPDMDWIKFWPQ